jgi:hypothetical protein
LPVMHCPNAQPTKIGAYTFQVQQPYSHGQVVNWADPKTGQNATPAIKVVSSVGGGSLTLAIVALVLGAVGVLVGCIAVASRGSGMQLA